MAVAEAPGKDEDEVGVPLVGAAGEIFNMCLEKAGINRKDIFVSNMLHCRPPHNDIKHAAAVEGLAICPKKYLTHEIVTVNPRVLVVMGRTAAVPYFSGRTIGEAGKLARVVDRRIVVGCYHPAYAFEFRGGSAIVNEIVKSFERARRLTE
jgi:DNA polymerase